MNFKKYPKPEGVSAKKISFMWLLRPKPKWWMLPIGCIHVTSPGSHMLLQTKAVWQEASCPSQAKTTNNNGKQTLTKAGSSKMGHTAALLGSVTHKCLHHFFYCSTILGVDPTAPTGCCHFREILLHSFWPGLGMGSAGLPLAVLGVFPVPCPQSPHWCCHSAHVSVLLLSFQHHIQQLRLREKGGGWMAGAEDTSL